MEIELTVRRIFDARYLYVKAGARYWEDSILDGKEDCEGKMPCRDGDYWCPVIDIDNGCIINWESGKTASIHYKICDDGYYILKDDNLNDIASIDGYVPKIMCPEIEGCGDYIIMNIDEKGKIKNWKPSFQEFNYTER